MTLEPLWNADQLASYLGVSPATVARQASQEPDKLPPRVASLRLLRWCPAVVREWTQNESRRAERPRRGRARRPT